MFVLSAIGNVLMTILAWIIMLLLNGIAWAFILLILTVCVGIFIESVFPESAMSDDAISIMMFISSTPINALAALVPTYQVNTSPGVQILRVVAPEETPFDVYEFYINTDDPTPYQTQKVVEGDDLYAPDTPAVPGSEKFSGWYIEGSGTPLAFDGAGTLTVESVSGKTVKVVARFATYNYATFYAEDGTTVHSRISAENGQSISISEVEIPVSTSPTKNFSHWNTNKNGTGTSYNSDDSLKMNQDI